MKAKLLSVIAIGSVISSSPVFSFSCASESSTFGLSPNLKYESGKMDKTLAAFITFADHKKGEFYYNSKIVESWAVIDGERTDCSTAKKSVKAKCGPLTIFNKRSGDKIPRPLNAPYPFGYAIYNSEEYVLVSRYAANKRHHQFRFGKPWKNSNLNDPNWLAPSNAASIKQCKSWEEIKNEPRFNSLVEKKSYDRFKPSYLYGEIVCIEEVKCSENSATTFLSINASLVPIKYLPTITAISKEFSRSDESYSSWKSFLTKVNPILKRDDLINIKYNIVISTPMESYSSEL